MNKQAARKPGNNKVIPWIIAAFFLELAALVLLKEKLDEQNLMLLAIYVVFATLALIPLSLSFSAWKTPADKFISDWTFELAGIEGKMRESDRIRFFWTLVGVAVFAAVRSKNWVPLVMFLTPAAVIGYPLVDKWIRQKQGKTGAAAARKSKIRPLHILVMLLSLVGTGFFFIIGYHVVLHSVWMMLPVLVGFVSLFLRPAAAVITVLIREFRDPGEKYTNPERTGTADPWDRPDKQQPWR